MTKRTAIPVHGMEDWFSGVYLKAMSADATARPAYERSEPHRHNFYYAVLLEKGELEIEVDFQTIRLTGGSLFLSYPGQVHSIQKAKNQQGWFLAFDPVLLSAQLKDTIDQCLSFVMLTELKPEQAENLAALLRQLNIIYADESRLFREHTVPLLVAAIVSDMTALYYTQDVSKEGIHPARSLELTKQFKQLLRANDKTIKKPAFYADQMHLSVTYLNDAVKEVTGFPLTYHIQQELTREAQRLLVHTDQSVKEIAFALGFEDERYFNRLFSKISGQSPGKFKHSKNQ